MHTAIPYDQLLASPTLRRVEVSYGTDDPKIEHETKEGYIPFSTTVPFDPAWFTLPADRYNPLLATSSMGLTSATYGNRQTNGFSYILDTMASYGFQDVDVSSFLHRNRDDHTDIDRDVNLVAYAFGHQALTGPDGEVFELVACVVRGTSPTMEWLSNADVADSVTDGDYASLRWHEGFRASELECLGNLERYLRDHGLDAATTRIWNCGHSRGGPVSNILGMDLDTWGDRGFSVTPDHVYTYTLACSLTTFDEDAHGPRYANIWNINHPEDFIGRIPAAYWGFRRYGTDVFLPSIATAYRAFQRTKADSDRRFLTLGGATRAYTVHGIAGPDSFVHEAVCCAATVAEMYTLPHAASRRWHPFSEFFQAFCRVAGSQGGAERVRAVAGLGRLAAGAYWHALSYFVEDQFLKPLSPITHNEQHYLARLEAVDALREDVLDGWRADTRRITFYGTLDVDVICLDGPHPTDTFDDGAVSLEGTALQPRAEGGRVVSRIAGGRVDADLLDTPDSVAVYADHRTDRLSVWLPVDGRYLVRLTAREDNAAIDATCAVCHPEGAVLAQEAFSAGSLAAGHSMVLDGADLVGRLPRGRVEEAWARFAERGDFPPTLAVDAVPYPTRPDGGDAVGDRGLMPGDHALLRAYEVRGHRFRGWHEDAGDGTPGRRVSEDRLMTVKVVEEGARYVAVFD